MSLDLTTFTEVDPNARLSVTSSTVTITGLLRAESAYVYYDNGAGHWGSRFFWRVHVHVTSSTDGGFFVCTLFGNAVGWLQDNSSGTALWLRVFRATGGQHTFQLSQSTSGSQTNSSTYNISSGTDYYCEIERNGTAATCKIYSDSGYSSLLTTLSVTVGSSDTYRYSYAITNSSTAASGSISGTIGDVVAWKAYYPSFVSEPLSLLSPLFSPYSINAPLLSVPSSLLVPSQQATKSLSSQLALLLTALTPTSRARKSVGSVLDLALDAYAPTWLWDVTSGLLLPIVYKLVLTGDAETPPVADLELPLEGFSARMKSGEPSYVSAVVCDPYTYSSGISTRTNGDIVIYRGVVLPDGTKNWAEIARANLETIADDRGGTNASITLSGYKQQTTATPKSRTMTGVSYRHVGDGPARYRCDLDTQLRAADTAVFPTLGESIVVGSISYSVDGSREQMDLTEAT